MKNIKFCTYVVILLVSFLLMGKALAADDIPRMTKDELKAILNVEDVTILDVRLGKDWKSSEFKIKGAIRTDPKQIDKWSKDLRKENRLVLYCA